MSSATGDVKHVVVRHRLQQLDHQLKVIAGGKAFVVDITIRCATELFPDSIFEFT
jgi:hypothetical protein